MNPAERIFRIHALLKKRTPVTMTRLQAALGASHSTIKRDIEYMRNFMRAPIACRRNDNVYRYDPDAPEFELPGLWFNADELYALLASEQLLESVQPGLLAPYIGPLKSRIRKLLEQSGHASDTVSHRVRVVATAARRVDDARFGAVAGAVLQGGVIEIEYHGRERDSVTRRRVHPYRLIHYRSNWYLATYCEHAQAVRTFSLDRIRSATATGEHVRRADDAALDHLLGASFGIFSGEAKAWAVLRFSDPAARWVVDEQWHPDQIGQWKGDVYELQVPYSDPRELVMDILKHGEHVEVIAPDDLRKSVVNRLSSALERYSKYRAPAQRVAEQRFPPSRRRRQGSRR